MFVREVSSENRPAEIRRCFEIRRAVFIDEQAVPIARELDGLDIECRHFLAWRAPSQPLSDSIGTARLRIGPNQRAKVQRVAVLAEARTRGVGRALMSALETAARAAGCDELTLSAQLSALPFYEAIGYAALGDVFEEAGILHRKMTRRLN